VTLIRDLLKAELKTAAKLNAQVPATHQPDLMAMVEDVTHSDSLSMMLIQGVQQGIMHWNPVTVSLMKLMQLEDRTGKMGEAVRDNPGAFLLPLSMLYYGIQIGRKLATEEAGLQKDLEWLKGLDLKIDPNEPEKK